MSAHGPKTVIFAALAGNTLIAMTKFAAAAWTGSSAMLSEAIHSLVDTGNQGLLLHGLKRAARPADKAHPFGHAREIYFWSFVVAILIFAVGAGVSIYEGIHKITNPKPMEDVFINYTVLGLAFIFEGGAWWLAFAEFRKTKGMRGFLEAIQHSKDPTVFTVLFEDSAAMLGLVAAAIGIFFTHIYHLELADGMASIVIGFILAGTAMALAIETKGLLIGEAASDEVIQGVTEIVNRAASVEHINEIRSMHMGPRDILLTISLDFRDDLSAGSVEETIHILEMAIKSRFPEITRLFIEVQSRARHNDELAARAV